LAPTLAPTVAGWTKKYRHLRICLGKDYLAALPLDQLQQWGRAEFFEGPIGFKRQRLGRYLRNLPSFERRTRRFSREGRLEYFLPDWDDVLDPAFDFRRDKFSAPKETRGEVHCAELMRPHRISDGILVSLAQGSEAKGPLKFVGVLEPNTLRPIDLRAHYALDRGQTIFGD